MQNKQFQFINFVQLLHIAVVGSDTKSSKDIAEGLADMLNPRFKESSSNINMSYERLIGTDSDPKRATNGNSIVHGYFNFESPEICQKLAVLRYVKYTLCECNEDDNYNEKECYTECLKKFKKFFIELENICGKKYEGKTERINVLLEVIIRTIENSDIYSKVEKYVTEYLEDNNKKIELLLNVMLQLLCNVPSEGHKNIPEEFKFYSKYYDLMLAEISLSNPPSSDLFTSSAEGYEELSKQLKKLTEKYKNENIKLFFWNGHKNRQMLGEHWNLIFPHLFLWYTDHRILHITHTNKKCIINDSQKVFPKEWKNYKLGKMKIGLNNNDLECIYGNMVDSDENFHPFLLYIDSKNETFKYIDLNGVDISKKEIKMKFSGGYLFMWNTSTHEFWYCYLKAEEKKLKKVFLLSEEFSDISIVTIPPLPKTNKNRFDTSYLPAIEQWCLKNNIKSGCTRVSFLSANTNTFIDFSPDGNIIIPEE